MTNDQQVRRLMLVMPDAWHAEYKSQVARSIIASNAADRLALDARPESLDRQLNHFFHGDQQMPASSAAAMPLSMSPDNYTGGHHYRRRAGAADQPYSAQQVIDFVAACLQQCDDSQQAELLQGLAGILDSATGTVRATHQESGSTVRLPIGAGVAPHELIAPEQSSAGSFGGEAESWRGIASPPSATDSRPGRFSRSRGRHRPAQDSTPTAERWASFSARFPDAARVEV